MERVLLSAKTCHSTRFFKNFILMTTLRVTVHLQKLQSIHDIPCVVWGFPGGARAKEPTCQRRRHERWVRSPGLKDSLEKAMKKVPLFLPEESHGQRSRASHSP